LAGGLISSIEKAGRKSRHVPFICPQPTFPHHHVTHYMLLIRLGDSIITPNHLKTYSSVRSRHSSPPHPIRSSSTSSINTSISTTSRQCSRFLFKTTSEEITTRDQSHFVDSYAARNIRRHYLRRYHRKVKTKFCISTPFITINYARNCHHQNQPNYTNLITLVDMRVSAALSADVLLSSLVKDHGKRDVKYSVTTKFEHIDNPQHRYHQHRYHQHRYHQHRYHQHRYHQHHFQSRPHQYHYKVSILAIDKRTSSSNFKFNQKSIINFISTTSININSATMPSIKKFINKKVEKMHDKFEHVALTSLVLDNTAKDHSRRHMKFLVPEPSGILLSCSRWFASSEIGSSAVRPKTTTQITTTDKYQVSGHRTICSAFQNLVLRSQTEQHELHHFTRSATTLYAALTATVFGLVIQNHRRSKNHPRKFNIEISVPQPVLSSCFSVIKSSRLFLSSIKASKVSINQPTNFSSSIAPSSNFDQKSINFKVDHQKSSSNFDSQLINHQKQVGTMPSIKSNIKNLIIKEYAKSKTAQRRYNAVILLSWFVRNHYYKMQRRLVTLL